MAIDYIGREGGWGTCQDCNGNIRATEIGTGVFMLYIPRHDATCPSLHEVTC